MNLKSCEKKEKNLAEIIVTISAEEFESAQNEAYRKSRNQISVPGFRRGKAPRKIIESMYGASIFHDDALDIILPAAYTFCVKETELRVVGAPKVTDVDIKKNEGADVTFEAALYPEVTIGQYKGLAAVRPDDTVPESSVDGEVADMRLRNARIETVSRPAISGDTVLIDYEGFLDGTPFEGGKDVDHELELGSNAFIPGFEEKLLGMSAGDEREIDLVFPENYAEHLAGKAVVFKVNVKEVKEKILPELDDEFAKDVSEFDTLEEYKNNIREKLLAAKTKEADDAFETALVDKAAETLEGDIPDAMIEEHLDNSMSNFRNQLASYGMEPDAYLNMLKTTPEEFRERMRETSVQQVRIMLTLEKIAELEGIEVSDEEVEDNLRETAARYGADIEDVRESIEKDAVVRDIKMRKAAKLIRENGIAEAQPAPAEESEGQKAAEEKPKAKKTAGAKKPAASEKATSEDGEKTDNE